MRGLSSPSFAPVGAETIDILRWARAPVGQCGLPTDESDLVGPVVHHGRTGPRKQTALPDAEWVLSIGNVTESTLLLDYGIVWVASDAVIGSVQLGFRLDPGAKPVRGAGKLSGSELGGGTALGSLPPAGGGEEG